MRNSMQTTFGNKSVLGSNAQAITQLYKKEKYMKYILPTYNLKWLENKMTFGFSSKPSAPPPPPKKSEAEVNADANRDRNLRAEQANQRKQQSAGKRRRRGRSLLISNDEKGLKDTLG